MIKQLIKFASGDIIKVDQTSKRIVLSDGTSWNSHLFHQCLGIVRIFLNRAVDDSEEIRAINAEIERRQVYIVTERQKELDALKLRITKQMHRLQVENYYLLIAYKLPFGKYKGREVRDIALIDKRYLDWFFSVSKVSLEKAFALSEPPGPLESPAA